MKVVGLPPTTPEDAMIRIQQCNPELTDNIKLFRSYFITNGGSHYLNIVVETSCNAQQMITDKRKLLFGLKSVRAFEIRTHAFNAEDEKLLNANDEKKILSPQTNNKY